jgi:hypothetical protein
MKKAKNMITFLHHTSIPPMRLLKSFTLFILPIIFPLAIQAQVYPVTVNTIVRAPYSLNLSDYASPTYDRIQVNLFMADITKVNYPVKVRLIIKGEGGITLSTIPSQEIGPLYLNGGENLFLSGADLNQLFNPEKLNFSGISYQQYKQNAALPEGNYQFQFEIVDYNLGVTISNVNSGFASAWLILNDPPLINQPAQNATVVPQSLQNIFFQWTPRHTGSPNSAFTTVYDIQLVEIYPASRNANDAMLSSPVIFEKTVFTTSYNYNVIDPYLFPDKWYAFRVKAHDVDNRDFFKNQGYSEVYRFYYGAACATPDNIRVDPVDLTSALVYWDAQSTHLSAEVSYREKGGSKYTVVPATTNQVLVSNLKAGTTYLFKVAGKCINNNSLASTEIEYTTAGGTKGGKDCDLPLIEDVKAIATSLTDATVSWSTETWFDEYIFRYKPLGVANYVEINTKDPKGLLKGMDPNVIYEYQIKYHCYTGVWVDGKTNTFKITVPAGIPTTIPTGDCFPPLDLTHVVNKDLTVSIAWPKDKDVKSYYVYWKEDVKATSWDSILVKGTEVTLSTLKPSTDYVYQIKSVCNIGLLSIASKAGKFNTTYLPVGGACNAPKLKPFTVVGPEEVKLEWEVNTAHTGYVLEYRVQKTTSWVATKLTNPFYLVTGLDRTKKYEYHVYAFCGLSTSDFSLIDTFSTAGAKAQPFICGTSKGVINITNRNPIANLKVGDKFTAADFEMEVKALTSSGPYTGEASTKIPYLKNSSFVFGMENVQVNELNQMYAGKVYLKKANLSLLDPKLAAKIKDMLDQVDQGFTTLEGYLTQVSQLQDDINGYISSAEGGNKVGKVKTGAVQATQTLTIAVSNVNQINSTGSNGNCQLAIQGDDGSTKNVAVKAPATIMDSKGTIYAVDNTCAVTKAAELITLSGAGLNTLDASATVTFVEYSKQTFGFSAWNAEYAKSPEEWAARYELLGSTYRVPSVAIEPGVPDLIKATLTGAVADKSKVIFATGKGVKFTSKSLGGNDYEITIVGGPEGDAQELYALYPEGSGYKSLGKLLIASYKHKKRTLVLVPVNGSTVPESAIATKLNKIYKPYGVEWEVKTDANFTDMSWDNNGVEGLQVEGSGITSTLTDEMKALNEAYSKARTPEPTNVYLFVLPKSEVAGVEGDMPRAKQFGYLFSSSDVNKLAHVAAHEVGHGLFLLRHTFDGYDMEENALPDNLMDYAGGEKLAKLQWDVMHDPGIVLGVFERDEDAMAKETPPIVVNLPYPAGYTPSMNTASGIKVELPAGKKFKFIIKDAPTGFPKSAQMGWTVTVKGGSNNEYKYNLTYDYIDAGGATESSAIVNLTNFRDQDTIWIYIADFNAGPGIYKLAYDAIILRKKLELTGLRAYDMDAKTPSKRVAKEGETLFLVENQNVKLVALGKGLLEKYETPDLEWNISKYARNGYYEDYKITRGLTELKDNFISSKFYYDMNWPYAGSTQFLHYVSASDLTGHTFKVNIKTLKVNKRAYEWMLPGTKEPIEAIAKSIEGFLLKATNVVNKIVPAQYKVEVEIDEEDPDSRFYNIVESGSLKWGIKAESGELPIPSLTYLVPNLFIIGGYTQLGLGVHADFATEKRKRSDKTTYTRPYNEMLSFIASGNMKAGVKVEFLKGKDYFDFVVKGFAQAGLSGGVQYNFTTKQTSPKLQLDPLVLGYTVKIASKGYLEFELVDWEGTINITDPIVFY